MIRRWLPVVWLLLGVGLNGLGGVSAAAEDDNRDRKPDLAGVSTRLAGRLENADKLAAEKNWAGAVEEYQKIIDEAGDDLLPAGSGRARRFVAARLLCQRRLAALPPEGLARYRARVEGQARRWLDQGRAAHDERLLRRVVDETFASASAGPALDLLGDLAFERGRFAEAEAWWRLLALPAGEVARTGKPHPADALVYPDPSDDLTARARAKQLLARLFRGDRQGAAERLATFRALHPTAAGRLAGRVGRYADTLADLTERADALAPPPTDEAWTTFAANPARNPILPADLPASLWRDGYHWRFSLQTHLPLVSDDIDRLPVGQAARSLAFHPVIVGDWAVVADPRYVIGFNLRTGMVEQWYDLQHAHADVHVTQRLPAEPGLRCTLSVADGRVYARMGVPGIGPGKAGSFLVGLDIEPGPDGQRRSFALTPPPGPDKAHAAGPSAGVFEGSPIAHDGRLWVAVTRFTGTQTITAVQCYDANRERDAPTLLWRQDVCLADSTPASPPRIRHHLLTLAGPEVVYCAQNGAIVALDSLTGRRAWAVRYPPRSRTDDDDGPSPRDLVPCLYADGRIYAAPADANRVLCLDAQTGQILWERERIEVAQFIGVTRGRLICTTTTAPSTVRTPVRGIRALDVATGDDVAGWLEPADGDLPAFGQGLVAGGRVYWPTSDGVRVLNVEDGQPAADLDDVQLRRLMPGNLAYGNGYLVSADTETLYAYVPARLELESRAGEARQARGRPTEALARFRLAVAEMDADLSDQALEDLRLAERLASPDTSWRGQPLRDVARRRRQELLLDRADRAAATSVKEADALLARAAGPEFAVPERLHALGRQAALWTRAGQPVRAVAVWQSVLRDDSLRRGRFPGPDGLPHQAGAYAARQIDGLIRGHGPSVYEEMERQARALRTEAAGAEQVPVLERLAREYPNALVTGPALLQLATLHEEAGRPGAAAHAYRRFLQRHAEGPERARALAGLARSYERQHCWDAARSTWKRLAQEQGDQTVPALDARQTIRQRVTMELQKPEYRAADRSAPSDLTLPLLRTWHEAVSGRLLLSHGTAAGSDRLLLFFTRPNELVCRDGRTGAMCWRRTLTTNPFWLGRHADLVLVAGEHRVTGLRQADGAMAWELELPGSVLRTPEAGAPPNEALGGFRLTSARLFFLQGGRRLFALDADSGHLLWSQWAPGAPVRPPAPAGRFTPLYHAGEERLVLQTSGGKLWVLDAATGQKLFQATTSRTPWSAPRVLDQRHVGLVTGARHVVLFDPVAGRPLWTYEVEHPTSLTGEPLHVGGGASAIVVAIPRNYGAELACLDPGTGRCRWEARVGAAPFDVRTAALDETAIYWTQRGVVHARALSDGKHLWEAPLPGTAGPWRVTRTRRYLLASPVGPRPNGEYAVAVFDPKDGQLLQRLNIASPVQGGDMDGDGLVLALFDQGAAVVAGDQVWGLSAAR